MQKYELLPEKAKMRPDHPPDFVHQTNNSVDKLQFPEEIATYQLITE